MYGMTSILDASISELAREADENEEFAAKLRAALNRQTPVDWESALDAGIQPCLALGAERRFSR
jgi:hypothetical protein